MPVIAVFRTTAANDFSDITGLREVAVLTCDGSTLYESGIYSYSYNVGLGTATWVWRQSYFNISSGGAYSCTISLS